MKSFVTDSLLPVLLLSACVLLGYGVGMLKERHNNVLQEIDYNLQLEELKRGLREEQNNHLTKQSEHLFAMQELRAKHEQVVSTIQSEYSDKLLQSEQRGNLYRARAATSSTEVRDLAEHAARLDRSLTEGRELVRELREHIRQHEVAFSEVTQYLIADRNHLNDR